MIPVTAILGTFGSLILNYLVFVVINAERVHILFLPNRGLLIVQYL